MCSLRKHPRHELRCQSVPCIRFSSNSLQCNISEASLWKHLQEGKSQENCPVQGKGQRTEIPYPQSPPGQLLTLPRALLSHFGSLSVDTRKSQGQNSKAQFIGQSNGVINIIYYVISLYRTRDRISYFFMFLFFLMIEYN